MDSAGVFLGPTNPTLEEKVATITGLLNAFDPSKSERYSKRKCTLRRKHWWNKLVTVTAYPVAWHTYLTEGLEELKFSANLFACAWVVIEPSQPHRFIGPHMLGGWKFMPYETVVEWYYDDLLLGLQGNFALIDARHQEKRQAFVAKLVDNAIEKAAQRKESAAKWPEERIQALDRSDPDFAAQRQAIIKDMLEQ